MDPVDPKLKDAAREIRAVLAKYDCAAVVGLCSGERSEYINFLFEAPHDGPTWSCLVLGENEIRVRAKASKNHVERWRLNLTAKMVHTFRDLMAMQFDGFDKVCNLISDNMRVEHGERAHEPGV